MSYTEARFIGADEFSLHENNRLFGYQVTEAEIYIAMFSLVKNTSNKNAAKLPARIKDMTVHRSGDCTAKLSLLNGNFKEVLEVATNIVEGYCMRLVEQNLVMSNLPVSAAYLLRDDLSDGPRVYASMGSMLLAPEPRLAYFTA